MSFAGIQLSIAALALVLAACTAAPLATAPSSGASQAAAPRPAESTAATPGAVPGSAAPAAASPSPIASISPVPTSTPAPSSAAYAGPYDPKGPDRNCTDFASQREAQAFYEAAGGPAADPHHLDSNRDGKACEDLR